MQLDWPGNTISILVTTFQYPLSDRRWCNLLFSPHICCLCKSFSILYRIVGDATSCPRSLRVPNGAFSILYRIVGDATMQAKGHGSGPTCSFSILYRIVGDATILSISCYSPFRIFQYPLSDRRWCNFPAEYLDERIIYFQYPLSDRRWCNHLDWPGQVCWTGLSVSSIGS